MAEQFQFRSLAEPNNPCEKFQPEFLNCEAYTTYSFEIDDSTYGFTTYKASFQL